MSAAGPVRRCAVLGSPVAHSLSPAMHRAAYARLGLPWTYEAIDVGEQELAGVLAGLGDEWRGLSLTMPLKRAAVPLCEELTPVARRVGGVNTILLGGGRRHGDNTDVSGMVAALCERGVHAVSSAMVLGGGATAVSAAAALTDLGLRRLHLAVREPSRAASARDRIGSWGVEVTVGRLDTLGQVSVPDVVVSTVPPAASAELGSGWLRGVPTVFEVVYDPWPTPLSEAAARAGAQVLDGLDLLAHQARLQVRAMAGLDVDVDLLRTAGRAELARRR